jgi:protoporphyrinogen oxidase
MSQTVILGAGLAGLSASFHLGHENCVLLESSASPYGHIRSQIRDGFTWDEGPHVSFTQHEYVRSIFAESVGGDYEEFRAKVGNYFQGHWIDHPAQVSLHQVPEPLRSRCLESFLESRRSDAPPPANYQEWLDQAFGPVFARTFPAVYTEKYWTRPPRDLATDWVGPRVLTPAVDDVVAGANGTLARNLHYITTVRYPRRGGYQSFAALMRRGASIRFGAEPARINLVDRKILLSNGETMGFERLVSTIPLPVFVGLCSNVPPSVREAAQVLECSKLQLVNFRVREVARRPETWFYVYDHDKFSTRVNFTEHLASGNAPAGWSGVQVEVYAGKCRPFPGSEEEIAARVRAEIVAMGICEEAGVIDQHSVQVPWANVIFTGDTRPALDVIWSWLEQHGLSREDGDTHPLTDWNRARSSRPAIGAVCFAGRYSQWKYFWTDDCVLRGQFLAGRAPRARTAIG